MFITTSLSNIATVIDGLAALTADKTRIFDWTSQSARKVAIQAARRLITNLEKPEETIQHTAFLPIQNICARIAIDLNLFQIVIDHSGESQDVPVTSVAISESCNAESLFIVRIMRILVANGFFNEAGHQSYLPNEVTRTMTQPKYKACIEFFFDQALITGAKVPEYFRQKGFKSPRDARAGPFQYAINTDLETFHYWSTQPRVYETFNILMTGSKGSKLGWTHWFPIKENLLLGCKSAEGSTLMVDIGGGIGTEISEFYINFPSFPGRLILQDLPPVIRSVKELQAKVERQEYNFFTPQLVRGARIYYFHFVLHDWPDEMAIEILRNTASAMEPGYSKLIINELILPDIQCSLFDAGLDINMMNLHSGIERSESQWTSILNGAGLEVVKFWYNPGEGPGVIEAILS
ncbi:S-adenosyl-L-methionine-dependent methyltransferase [Penicillium macrosclerotiorum]|uniref:S-adenosyl-L-methionine-dependent methyltransferase n=1 Tax=Penicillium macrosclerotiorum TaxID=303699 RepID=UPI002548F35F|nr:S-adenosyl-L-methionine-dependent methyltransferase [Penicillium macrosclerotiorum]KAJ5675961.1 S-adenosyl-L-methionine-dependent methyltransferase [Penicillium macrosclerotiorum]